MLRANVLRQAASSALRTRAAVAPAPASLSKFHVLARTSNSAAAWQGRGGRLFSTTPRRQASEDMDSLVSRLKDTQLFRELVDKPEALKAVQEFGQLMQKQGLDTTRPPTTMEMMKLAMNSEFRQGAQKLMEELKKAGIDLTNSSEMVQEVMSATKKK